MELNSCVISESVDHLNVLNEQIITCMEFFYPNGTDIFQTCLKAMFYCRQFLDCAFSQFQCQRLVKSLESFQHFVTDSDEYKTLVILEL